MTVRHFDGTDDKITLEPLSPVFQGHGTLACIWRADDSGDQGLMASDAGGFERWALLPVGGDQVYVDYSGFSTVQAWSADEWYVTVVTKPVGNSAIRKHSMPFSTGVWTHAAGGTVNDETAIGAHDATYLGWVVNSNFFLAGDMAVAGVWVGDELSDADCETLPTELSNWLDLAPSALWSLNQEDVGDPVLDLSGNGFDQTAITGTSVLTGDDPPGFNNSLVTDTRFYRDGGVWVPVTRQVRQGGSWVAV